MPDVLKYNVWNRRPRQIACPSRRNSLYAQMRHHAFTTAMAIKKVSAHSLCIRGIRDTWAPSPAPGSHRSDRCPGDGKRRWRSSRVKPARASGSPRCAGVHSVRNVSAHPVQPLGRQCPGFHMMESCAAIRIPCFAHHCFRAASPPYPSTIVDFRTAPGRLTKPVQAGRSSSSGLASHRVQPPARTLASLSTPSRHTGLTAIVGARSRTAGRVRPPPLPRHEPCHCAVGTPFACRLPERLPASTVGTVGEKAAKGIGS